MVCFDLREGRGWNAQGYRCSEYAVYEQRRSAGAVAQRSTYSTFRSEQIDHSMELIGMLV